MVSWLSRFCLGVVRGLAKRIYGWPRPSAGFIESRPGQHGGGGGDEGLLQGGHSDIYGGDCQVALVSVKIA
jgi:hypothetical protein